MSGSTTSTTFGYTGQTVTWTVPSTGLYDITAAGAKGGNGGATFGVAGISFGRSSGGPGALMGGDYELTQGEVLTIAVGGQGAQGRNSQLPNFLNTLLGGGGGGGGGGSFVVGPNNTPIVVAGGGGGGGGGRREDDGGPGLTGTAGGSGAFGSQFGGDYGSGGQGAQRGGGGGGGFRGSGGTGDHGASGGGGYPGLAGGGLTVTGGFGGGGGGNDPIDGRDQPGGGGGGGYSGGGGSRHQGGGGGGSYLAAGAIDPVKVQGQNQGAGDVTIALVSAAPVVTPPTLAQPVLRYTVGEGQTLQGLYGDILANAEAANPSDQASLTLTSIGEAGTAGFLYPDLAQHMLTYTADGYNPNKPTDSFTYTVADPGRTAVTGTVDISVTGPSLPTAVGTAGPDTLSGQTNIAWRLLGLDGNDRFEVNGPDLAFGGRGDDNFQALGQFASGSTIYGGPGTNFVNIGQGAASPKDVSVALQQGGVDQVLGFSVQNGDVLDLRQALAESQLNLGGNYGGLGNYVAVSDSGSDATLSFNPQGLASGPGSALAVLHGVGPGVTLATLISDHALRIT